MGPHLSVGRPLPPKQTEHRRNKGGRDNNNGGRWGRTSTWGDPSLQSVTNLELQTEENIACCRAFDQAVAQRLGDPESYIVEGDGKVTPQAWELDLDFDEDFNDEFHNIVSYPRLPEANDMFTPEIENDTYLSMELALPRGGGEVEFGRVTKRLRDKDGLPIGTANENPMLNTCIHGIEFPDGRQTLLAANAILAENNLFG